MAIYKQITANAITLSDFPFIKELAMEAYLIENENILILDDRLFNEVRCLDAEIALKNGGKNNNDGRIDLLVQYSDNFLGIVELKAGEIDEKAFEQLQGYLKEKEQVLEKNNDYWNDGSKKPNWIGVLVGTDISSELKDKLSQGLTFEGIPIAGMTIRRYRNPNNGEIFIVTDTYFNFEYNDKKGTKSFFFNGKYYYSTTKLVNTVVKHYVETHSDITFAKLKEKFPDKLALANYGVFTSVENAGKYAEKTYRMQPEDLVYLPKGNITICTCNYWRETQISEFIENAKKIGLEIKVE